LTLRYLFWGYTFIWILLAGYLGLLALRQRTLTRRLERLRAQLERQTGEKRP
jgi:CcmD family protein